MLDNGDRPGELMPDEPKKTKGRKRKVGGVEYIGGNRFIHGLPAKDMTAKEWRALPVELRKRGLALGLVKEL